MKKSAPLLSLLAAVAVVTTAAFAAEPAPVRVGQEAGALLELNYARADAPGDIGTLFGDNTQAATLVVFVSALCPCSQDYDARTAALAREYPNVRVVRVYSDRNEPLEDIRAQARAFARASARAASVFDWEGRTRRLLAPEVTPEVFLFDSKRTLRYRGRIDDCQDEAKVKKRDLRDALRAVLAGKPVPAPVTKAMGCPVLLGGQGKDAKMDHD